MPRILIVDDEELNLSLVTNFLKKSGLTIDTAKDGATALKLLQEYKYELLFFDHMMPGMNGMDLLNNLRTQEGNPNQHCPCIAMTGNTAEDAKATYLKAGFQDYIKKPVQKRVLDKMIGEYFPDLKVEERAPTKFSEEPPAADREPPTIDREPSAADREVLSAAPLSLEEAKLAARGSISVDIPKRKDVSEATRQALPEWLIDTEGLDVEAGIQINGSPDNYISAIRIFSESAQRKADEIEEFYLKGDATNYTIKVHALKSSAGVIGATDLADQAAVLETAGNTGDYDTIKRNNAQFLETYRNLGQALKADIRGHHVAEEKEEVHFLERKILLISAMEHILVGGLAERLEENDFQCTRCGISMEELENYQEFADLLIYYMDEMLYKNTDSLVYLKDLVVEQDKHLILIGTRTEYDAALASIPENCITKWVERPFDMDRFLIFLEKFYREDAKKDEKHKILIVDDDETYMELIKAWLEDRYDVVMASSGLLAIRWLARNKPDLILLDYEMPITNGPQLLEMLKSEAGTDHIPVMFLTGKQDKGSIMRVLNLKPTDYILKTIDRSSLLEKLDMFFKARRLL